MTVPVQGLHTLMSGYNFPECTEKQAHRQFGCRIGILARSVDDQNTSLRGKFHIYVTHQLCTVTFSSGAPSIISLFTGSRTLKEYSEKAE